MRLFQKGAFPLVEEGAPPVTVSIAVLASVTALGTILTVTAILGIISILISIISLGTVLTAVSTLAVIALILCRI